MQDRFKFRIWYAVEKKLMLFNNPTLLDGKVNSDDNGGLLFRNYDHNIKDVHECNPKDFTIMQCTGLKDRNGKLIYEGDILTILHSGDKKAVVYWNQTNVCYELKGEAVTYNAHITIRNDYFEVIGNIYENPELLESED